MSDSNKFVSKKSWFWKFIKKDAAFCTLELKNLILPAITLGIRPLAVIIQLSRSSLLDVFSMDYIRTARAKGLSNVVIIIKHALTNALNPVVTAISGWFASLLAVIVAQCCPHC